MPLLAFCKSIWLLLQLAKVLACHPCLASRVRLYSLITAWGGADDEFCRTFAAKIVSSVCKRSTSVLAECGLELQMLADLVRDPTCSAVTKQLLVYALVRVRPPCRLQAVCLYAKPVMCRVRAVLWSLSRPVHPGLCADVASQAASW